MDISSIIEALDLEIRKLQLAKAALTGSTKYFSKKKPGRTTRTIHSVSGGSSSLKTKTRLSAAGRASIAAAQKARWAKVKKAQKAI